MQEWQRQTIGESTHDILGGGFGRGRSVGHRAIRQHFSAKIFFVSSTSADFPTWRKRLIILVRAMEQQDRFL